MSEFREPVSHGNAVTQYPSSHTLPIAVEGPMAAPSSPLLRIGGGLGIAGSVVGLLIMLAACFGYERAIALSIIPVLLGAVGFVLSLVGALSQRAMISEDTHVMQALFVSVISVIGGLVEMAAWRGWAIFPQ